MERLIGVSSGELLWTHATPQLWLDISTYVLQSTFIAFHVYYDTVAIWCVVAFFFAISMAILHHYKNTLNPETMKRIIQNSNFKCTPY